MLAKIPTVLFLTVLPFAMTAAGEQAADTMATDLVVDLGRSSARPVAFSPDGRYVAAGNVDNTITLWEASSGRLIRTIEGRTVNLDFVVFSPDGRTMVSGGADVTVRFWDVSSGQLIRSVRKRSIVSSLAYRGDGQLVATGHSDGTVRLWDASLDRVTRVLKGHSGEVQSVAFSPNGCRLVSGSRDDTVKLWDASSGRRIRTFKAHGTSVYSVAVSPDGRLVASGAEDGVKLWDTSSGRPIWSLERHRASPTGPDYRSPLAFDPKGRFLAVGAWDGGTRLYAVGTSRREKPRGPAARRELCRLYVSPDGSWAVIGPDGRFDGSNGGVVPFVHWVIGTEIVDLHQAEEGSYEPGLLAKILANSRSERSE